jgi:hypothetical protein
MPRVGRQVRIAQPVGFADPASSGGSRKTSRHRRESGVRDSGALENCIAAVTRYAAAPNGRRTWAQAMQVIREGDAVPPIVRGEEFYSQASMIRARLEEISTPMWVVWSIVWLILFLSLPFIGADRLGVVMALLAPYPVFLFDMFLMRFSRGPGWSSWFIQKYPSYSKALSSFYFVYGLLWLSIAVTTDPGDSTKLAVGTLWAAVLAVLAYLLYVAARWAIVNRNASRIAAAMKASAITSSAAPLANAPATPGPLVMETLDVDDLPPAGSFERSVRTLFLYNFFANRISARTRPVAGWRLAGPVAMLASPLDVARAIGFDLGAKPGKREQLLLDASAVEHCVTALNDERIPIGSGTLPEQVRRFGAYSEDVLHCTDASWQAGILALTRCSAKVVMDASEFSAERHGLLWEIQHVVDCVALADVAVLVNYYTDLPALLAAFRTAWAKMDAASPNATPGELRLRIIFLGTDDKDVFMFPAGPGTRSAKIRDHERLSAHARIMTMLSSAPASG